MQRLKSRIKNKPATRTRAPESGAGTRKTDWDSDRTPPPQLSAYRHIFYITSNSNNLHTGCCFLSGDFFLACVLPPDCSFHTVSHCSEEDNACVDVVRLRRSTTATNTACPSRGGGGRVSDRRGIHLNLITQLLYSKAALPCVRAPAWYVLHSNRAVLLFLS